MKNLIKDTFIITNIIIFALTILAGIGNLAFETYFQNRIYPGVRISGVDFSGQTEANITRYFTFKLKVPQKIIWHGATATIEANLQDLNLRYDTALMGQRAYSLGRQTGNFYYDFLQKIAALSNQINLPAEITYDHSIFDQMVLNLNKNIGSEPVDASFKFEPERGPDAKGRVVTFRPSKSGLTVDEQKIIDLLKNLVLKPTATNTAILEIPTKILDPKITTTEVNRLGIKDLLGAGESYFYDSIPGRVANIRVGTEKVSGSLIAPGETFSFSNAIGTVSAVFGFSKAYAIKNGKTVLDDGGGVCQVSTTLYRAVLNAGLPVVQREPHSYRVGFYEEGGFMPGLDATVYPPNPDFQFKNDTPAWILLQATFDDQKSKLSFEIFGADDGRKTVIIGPKILSQIPPPDPIYEDDPISPIGQIRQIDTAHWGAKVFFTRTVTRGAETLIDESVYSNYIPWPARFLRGTKT